ncbi:hypothetical protein GCM10027321_44730 [Massilia terrae]|uniref:Uncharacterized protein n=1 Tax=Massilia terrae TaxID=1811224 RepID=A0ABT2CZG5_9BURK|nr:hypothetical protein [Massilia terrae]MCS0659369.1 hypothetical protein [Massilia terrae]
MASANTTQMRDALAWTTESAEQAQEPSSNPFVWLWEAIEGDFNENRSTKQLLVDAGISMIPLVDQVCDVRDLIANCRKLSKEPGEASGWIALALTLIGLFPTLGSLAKGVLKIFFGFVGRAGGHAAHEAINAAMSWVISFLRRKDVQKYLKAHNADNCFKWLAEEIRLIRSKINPRELIAAFDGAITVLKELAAKVEFVPVLGGKAKACVVEIQKIRSLADAKLAQALRPVQDCIDTIVHRLEMQALEEQRGIIDVANIHFRGALPESAAVALMRKRKPSWLTPAKKSTYSGLNPKSARGTIEKKTKRKDASGAPRDPKEIFPELTDQNIQSFHTLAADTIKGPARLYRILSPNSRAMSECWISEEVFKKIQRSSDPKAEWRKHLAVWPDWNADGQFVIYEIKAGESLNVWRGIASSQQRGTLPGYELEGGFEQIIFSLSRTDHRNDTLLYYPVIAGKQARLGKPMTQAEVDATTAHLSPQQKQAFFQSHLSLRAQISHPNIHGPFETGWGYSEFDGAGTSSKIGLPALPGQVTAKAR